MTRTANRFVTGSSVFTCRSCNRKTRQTGDDNDSLGLCIECFTLAGEDNSLSDTGELYNKADVLERFRSLAQHLGSAEAAIKLFPEVAKAAGYESAPEAPQAPQEAPQAPVVETVVYPYLVTVTGPDCEVLLPLDAKCSYEARRMAKRMVKAERSIDGLTFNARRDC